MFREDLSRAPRVFTHLRRLLFPKLDHAHEFWMGHAQHPLADGIAAFIQGSDVCHPMIKAICDLGHIALAHHHIGSDTLCRSPFWPEACDFLTRTTPCEPFDQQGNVCAAMTGLGVEQVRGFAGAKAPAIGIKFS
jgi:hypothetical protein